MNPECVLMYILSSVLALYPSTLITPVYGTDSSGSPQSTTHPVNAAGQPSMDADEVFTVQPAPVSYASPKTPATIRCSAKNADSVIVKCQNVPQPLDSVKQTSTVESLGYRLLSVEFQVTRDTVYEFLTDYFCVCAATFPDGRQVVSRRGKVEIASLKKTFPQAPIEVSAESMTTAELMCRPPEGQPRPEVSWEKDGRRLDAMSDRNLIITSEGSLLINLVTASDEGNYTCVAANEFFNRRTDPARLYVYTNGNWSPWSPWQPCNTQCGNGMQQRSRLCNNPPPSGRDGLPCEGAEIQNSPCTKECPPVNGGWSDWGQWNKCSDGCQRYRYRHCNNPEPKSGRTCLGSDVETANCTDNVRCTNAAGSDEVSASREGEPQNIILWVVLCVAVALFAIILVIIVVCLMKKKNRRNAMYDRDSADPDGSNSDSEKYHREIGQAIQPDITKTVPLRHQPPFANSRQNSVEHTVEKMPMLSNGLRPNVPREYYMQISAAEPSDTHDYMQIGNADNDSSEDKVSTQSSSPESGFCNSCDRQSLLSAQIPGSIDIDALSWGNVTHTGGRLSVSDSGISITIPEGAIGRNQNEEIFIAALREEKDKPSLLEKQTLLSPVFLCGPQGNTFNKSLILSFDHCASLKLGQWKLSIYASNSAYNETAHWERLVTLNQEILHTPVFCQIDSTRCHIMVDQLASRYCLVGESMYGSKAVKHLKLAAFATAFSGPVDCNVRVYVLPDTQDALHCVAQQESKLGARLMDKPKQISFQDGGHNLCLMIDSIASGWVSKLPAQYQEIPFRHVWNGQSNLHCSFTFEPCGDLPISALNCKIQIYQKSVLSNRQTINIVNSLETGMKVLGKKELSSTVTVNTQSSSGCSSMVTLDNRDNQIFKLPTSIKKKLASHLDTPCMRGNDWRMLASALSSDRQLNFFASKPSPTEALLDLWEARNTVEESSVTELTNLLRAMGRQDAVSVLEHELINAWV